MSPAVKRMEQTHLPFLIFSRTGFHNGADKDFQQSAADGVDHNGDQNTGKRPAGYFGKNRQQRQPRRGEQVGGDSSFSVSDFMNQPCGKQVDQQLQTKIEGDKERDLGDRDLVMRRKGQEEKRGEIIDDRLYDITGKAGADSRLVGSFHFFSSDFQFCFSYYNIIRVICQEEFTDVIIC